MKQTPGISTAVEFDHPRYYQFERSSGLPRGYFNDDPMDVFVRFRGWALVALCIVLALLALTGSDLPNL